MATKGNKGAKAAATAEAKITHIQFNGYPDDVPEEERFLTKDKVYEVLEVDAEGSYIVQAPNPQYNPKKAKSDKNSEFIEANVFPEEATVVDAPEVAAEEKKAPVAVKEGTKVKGGKAPAPAKEKVKAAKAPKVEAAPKEEAGEDALPSLSEEQEDAEVLALVAEAADTDALVGIAQQLEGDIATSEYRMGGILYHIKKDGGWKELNPAYKERGGFQAFLTDYMNVDYRKAMYLIDIYVTFSQSGLANPAETVARIGWTKASKIVKPMTEEGANVEDLVKLAEESTVKDLDASIKEQTVHVGGTKGEAKTKVSLKLRFYEEDAARVQEVLNAVKDAQGFSTMEEAFSFIVDEFAANFSKSEVAAEDAPAQTEGTKAKASAKPTPKKSAAKPRAAAAA